MEVLNGKGNVRAAMYLSFLTLVVLLSGCAASTLDPDQGLRLEAEGWVERGSPLELTLYEDGIAVAPSEWSMELSPSEAAEFDPSTVTVRPLRVGPLRLVATASAGQAELLLDVPAPPTIVFHKLVDGNRDIYTVALDGQDLQRLTTDQASDAEPTSADGRIVFTSFRNGIGSLYHMPSAGGPAEALIGSGQRESQARLDPNGARIAFIRTVANNPRLWIASADGSDPAALTAPAAGTIEASPTWAPTGDRLAYMSTANGTADIWIVTPGSDPTLLIPGGDAEVEPAWSHDGESIVFVSTRDGDTELYRLDLGTEEITRLTNRSGSDGQPAYLRDGRLVFTARTGNEAALYWMDPLDPAVVHPIPTGPGEPGAAAELR